jgi:hypothetical protein
MGEAVGFGDERMGFQLALAFFLTRDDYSAYSNIICLLPLLHSN